MILPSGVYQPHELTVDMEGRLRNLSANIKLQLFHAMGYHYV